MTCQYTDIYSQTTYLYFFILLQSQPEGSENPYGFLEFYTPALHKDYTLKRFLPDTLALATQRTEEEVTALYSKKVEEGEFEGKTSSELSDLYSGLWGDLLGIE